MKSFEKVRSLRFPIALGLFALAGCAGGPHPVPLNSYQVVTAPQPAPPTPAPPVAYQINPLDQLRIDVFGEPELSLAQLTVDPDGRIVLPLVGQIQASGRTTQQLSTQIATALNRYLRAPQVAVNVTEYSSQRVTVTGAVRAGGMFQTTGGLTLMDAIALGQGVTEFSKQNEIIVFRRQGGQRYIARFDLGAIQAGQAADPQIMPGDVVVVGFSESRRLFSDAIAVLPAAIGIFFALLN